MELNRDRGDGAAVLQDKKHVERPARMVSEPVPRSSLDASHCPPKQTGSGAHPGQRNSLFAATAESFGLSFMLRVSLRDRLFLSHRGCRCSAGSCGRGRGLGQYGRGKKGRGHERDSKFPRAGR